MYGLAGYDIAQNMTGKGRLEMTSALKKAKHWIQIGAEITEVCHESYLATPTKLGPDVFQINNRAPNGESIVESGKNITCALTCTLWRMKRFNAWPSYQ